jgi:hypothetical protein
MWKVEEERKSEKREAGDFGLCQQKYKTNDNNGQKQLHISISFIQPRLALQVLVALVSIPPLFHLIHQA